jgi:hypothetical protein
MMNKDQVKKEEEAPRPTRLPKWRGPMEECSPKRRARKLVVMILKIIGCYHECEEGDG